MLLIIILRVVFLPLEFKKPVSVVDTDEPVEKRKILRPKRKRLLGDIIKEANSNKKYYMGR